jgi:hypothetical protein
MKSVSSAVGIPRSAGLLGCTLIIFNTAWQIYEILAWGIEFDWHFKNIIGWGFGFLLHLAMNIFALILMIPFWLSGRANTAPNPIPGQSQINMLTTLGLLLFLLAVGAEKLLQIGFP